MISFKTFFGITLLVLGITGCSSPAKKEVPSGQLISAPNSKQMQGVVEKIHVIPKTASIWKELEGAIVGDVIGAQIGDGEGQDIAEDAGGVIGAAAMDQKYGSSIDHLFIKGENNQSYSCYVQTQQFKVGQSVVFTQADDKITAIVPESGD